MCLLGEHQSDETNIETHRGEEFTELLLWLGKPQLENVIKSKLGRALMIV